MNVQWYPGHMTKARRMMQEDIKLIDLVIELLDARIPRSSRNPDIDDLAKGKSRLILLNKSDLADPSANSKWLKHYTDMGIVCVLLDSRNRKGFGVINRAVEEACVAKIERDRKRGIIGRPVRAMVVGIPNVGKSTFINTLCKKASAKTGNKPGVTKGKQWIKLDKNIELLDTPGILWPKFDSEITGIDLAITGSVNDEIIDMTKLSMQLIDMLKLSYPSVLAERYGIEEDNKAAAILEMIARKRGCLKKGSEIDYDKASRILLDEFRSGRLGKITLEIP